MSALEQIDLYKFMEALEASLAEVVLPQEAAMQFREGAVSKKFLEQYARKLKKISDNYVSRGEGGYVVPFNESDAEAYALYFSPINFAKVVSLFRTLPPDFPRAAISALDFGCGPGTAAMAIAACFPGASIDACDHSKGMTELAEKLFAHFEVKPGIPDGARLRIITQDHTESYSLIVAANVINEIQPEKQLTMLQMLVSKLKPGGVLIILDPALQATTRRLMALRDQLLEKNPSLNPIFPCTRRDGCPMLLDSKTDWCHTTMHEGSGWQRPRLVKSIDAITGFNKHQVKYSAVIFQNGGKMKEGFRVISDSEKERRGHSALLCGKEAYGKVLLPKGAKDENNMQFTRLKSFDLVQITGIGTNLQLEAGSVVLPFFDNARSRP